MFVLILTPGCPAEVNVALHQVSAVTRPNGDVILKCDLSGVTIKEVEFYWWLMDETNSPIFIFSVSTMTKMVFCVRYVCYHHFQQ